MRYQQTVSQSSEILRLVLPNLPKHRAAYHPVSFAIWYEYVAGINPPLQQRIDALTQQGQSIDNELAYELYQEYILDAWSSQTLKVNTRLGEMVAHFEQSATDLSSESRLFDEAWTGFETRLEQAPDDVQVLVGDLLSEAGERVRQTVQHLRQELEASIENSRSLRAELEVLHQQVMTDPLTGLSNRRGLESAFGTILQEAMQRGSPCSLILIDVDHFKKLNDTHGHVFGDRVLKSVAQALQVRVRPQDVVARIGGEEFVIVLPDTGTTAALGVAETIRQFVERAELRNKAKGDLVARITVSAGVTGMHANDTVTQMIARADSAMYAAKEGGRNRVMLAA